MLRDTLLDIVKHTGGLGFVDTVKITGDGETTKVEAMDDDKTVIIKGTLNEHIPEFDGEFGMSNLNVLKGFADMANFRADDASIEVKRETRNGNEVPVEIVFTDGQGQTASFRLMDATLVPNQATFRGVEWDVEIQPEKSKILEFAQFSNVLSSQEQFFCPKTNKKQLRFHIGDDASAGHKSFLIFADNVKGQLKSDLLWPTQQVLSVLKLQDASKLKMQFADKGAMQIAVQSSFGEYNYILPARRR
jgi:hypothetical protein